MDKNINQRVGQLIRDAREVGPRLTQDDVAKRTGLSRASIANIEAGRQQISVVQLLLFASALGVPAETLLPKATAPVERLSDLLPKGSDPDLRRWMDKLQAGDA